jgi:hypothetical protein
MGELVPGRERMRKMQMQLQWLAVNAWCESSESRGTLVQVPSPRGRHFCKKLNVIASGVHAPMLLLRLCTSSREERRGACNNEAEMARVEKSCRDEKRPSRGVSLDILGFWSIGFFQEDVQKIVRKKRDLGVDPLII